MTGVLVARYTRKVPWANSGGKDGYALFWNVIEIDNRAFQNK